jgi:hypothetical protein
MLTGDPDYTLLAMTRFSEELKMFWGKIFGHVKLPSNRILLILGQRDTRYYDQSDDEICAGRYQRIQGVPSFISHH